MSLSHHHRHQQPPPFAAARSSPISNEEEHHSNNLNNPATTDDTAGDGKLRKGSPWQRMKWTDNMVKLLIMIVFYVGDEAAADQPDTAAKKKSGGGGGGGLQKKGKWKSVSWAMMEKGFYVSPQQCEDKFNDLNKRYKRVNDILGKGTSCKVVENQSLLETMDHIPTKLKEEVKKLLNSKHLFFREMCAYHSSCSGVSCDAGAAAGCGGGDGGEVHRLSPPLEVNTSEEDEIEDEEEDDGLSSRKRVRVTENDGFDGVQQFKRELSCVVQDLSRSVREKRQWMKVKMMELEEQRLGFQGELYELEKRRSKWLKFSYSKEREMDVEKMRNERMKLENERMVLMLRQKEMELVDVQQQQYSSNGYKRNSDLSSING
ncbi:hypothetical protein QVD17_14707 [Tagetes erecta]|uniref:Myb/SANT-like DNA-binding domain-containing protein n=1 Tax=Tagetes erecta TaxID=13708 RepID=A0AAD8KNI4_TARER|nr:hypothetical protein QVD17_14707 [Tagetes erecta]